MSEYIYTIWWSITIIVVFQTVTCQERGDASERPVIPDSLGDLRSLSDSSHVIPTVGLCRDGWSRGLMKEQSGREIPICIKINPYSQTWKEAQTTCRKNYGFMLKLDSNVIVNNKDVYSVLYENDIVQFWTGMHSEHGHLVWDDLLPNQVRPLNRLNISTSYIRPWTWENTYLGAQQSYCGSMHIESNTDDRRRRKRSPDDDSNDNIFPGLNFANFRNGLSNIFGRRNNRFPPTGAFQTLPAPRQASDQLAELPDLLGLPNGNSGSESNSPDSESQSGPHTTDTPSFDSIASFDSESDSSNAQFDVMGAGLQQPDSNDQNSNSDAAELLTSVKNVADTLSPGMDVGQTDSALETLSSLLTENTDAFNNDSPSFDSIPADQSNPDNAVSTDAVETVVDKIADATSDTLAHGDGLGSEVMDKVLDILTETPADQSSNVNGIDSDVPGKVVDILTESPSANDDGLGTEVVDTVVDNLPQSPSDANDVIENIAEAVVPNKDDTADIPSLSHDINDQANDVLDDTDLAPSPIPSVIATVAPENLDLDTKDVFSDSLDSSNPTPLVDGINDIAEGLKDKIDDGMNIVDDINTGDSVLPVDEIKTGDLIPSVEDFISDEHSDDSNTLGDEHLTPFPTTIPASEDRIKDMLDHFDDKIDDVVPPSDSIKEAFDNFKDSHLDDVDIQGGGGSMEDNGVNNQEIEHFSDLSDSLSDHNAEIQDVADIFLNDDRRDFGEEKTVFDLVPDSMRDRDNNAEIISDHVSPDDIDSVIDNIGDDGLRVNENEYDDIFDNQNDARQDIADLSEIVLQEPGSSVTEGLDKFDDNDHIERDNGDIIENNGIVQQTVGNIDSHDLNDDYFDSISELGQETVRDLDDFQTSSDLRQTEETETKRDFDWPNDNADDTDSRHEFNEKLDDIDLTEKEFIPRRQTVVDGNFGLQANSDERDERDDVPGHRDPDDIMDGLSTTPVPGWLNDDIDDDGGNDDKLYDLPDMAENIVGMNDKSAISPDLKAEMQLSSCDVKLPSVCFSYEILVSDEASTCEEGWYGHVLLDTCYKVLDNKMNYPEAVASCKSLNARVIIASTDFERRYSLMAVQLDGSFNRGETFWMESPSDTVNCQAFNERGKHTVPSCRDTRNVICVKDAKPLSVYAMNPNPGDAALGRFYDENGDLVVFSSTGDNNKLPCRLYSGAAEFPVLWFKDGVLISSKDKQVSSDISLDINAELLTSYSMVTNRSLSTPVLQGQYWCEVWDRQTLTTLRSRSFNVRFSDVISFHGSMHLGPLSREEEVLFNMMTQMFPKLSSAQQDIQKVFNDVLPLIKESVPTVDSVAAYIDGARTNPNIVEFHAYFTTARDYTPLDEHAVYNRVKFGLRSKLGNRNYVMDLPGRTPIDSFRTMSLQSTVACPSTSLQTTKDIYGHTIPVREFSFPTALIGEFANSLQNCSQTNRLPAGSARCLGDYYTGAYWSDIVAYECIDEILYDDQNKQTWAPSPYADELTNLAQAPVNVGNAEKLVSEVAQIAEVAPKFTPTDISKIADVLEHTTQVKNLPQKVGENVLKTVDRLMVDSLNEAHVANVETKAANRIIQSLERFAENADLGNQERVRFVSDNVAVEIWDLKPAAHQPVIGLAVESKSEDVSEPFKTETISTVYDKSHLYNADVDAAIELPEEVFSKSEKGSMLSDRLTMIVFRKSKLFQAAITDGGRRISPTDQQMTHLNSYIISASIAGKKIQDLKEKVKCIFKPKKESDGQNKCVWWDFTMNENKGGWSSRGCVYDGMVNGRDVCLCDHLTNFAVLIDFYGQGKPIPDHHELSLSIITVVGLSCSILGLSLTIISFAFFRKLRQGRAQQTLFNLSLSLLLSMLVFLVGIKQTQNDHVCIVVAILLHYLILVSFMWMLMEAILQYLTFVKILGTYITRFMLKTVLPAWGLPLLPVISVLSIDYTLYKGGPDYCWMDVSAFYYSFAVPVTCIIIINITIFVVTVISIFRRGKGLRSNQKKQKMAMTNLQAAITSFILLGLTWIFGYLAISDARLLFQYVFTILNSLQGFFIFILFVVRKKKVREQWYIICCKGSEKDRVSRSLSASNSIPSTYSNGSRNSRKDGRERDRSDSTKTIQSFYSNSSSGYTNYGYDNSYEYPFNRQERRAFRKF